MGVKEEARSAREEVSGMARPMKFETPEELERAVEAYFKAISYREPAVVATPTGEVDGKGRVQWKTKLLTEPPEEPGGIGKPVTVTKWLRPPGVAGLCLHLGISRDTWARYAKKPAFREIAERARFRIEDYWVSRLDSKSDRGAKFALSNNFGWSGEWRERRESGDGGDARKDMSVEAFLRREAAKDGGDYAY